MVGDAFEAGVVDAMIKVAERAERSGAVAVSLVGGSKYKKGKTKKSPKEPGDVMGLGSIKMKRGTLAERTTPLQQPDKPARY